MKQFLLLAILALPTFLLAQPNLTFNPADGATGVSVSNNLTITSDVNIQNADGSAITDTNVDNLITLEDDLGNPVAFDATIAGKTITVNPNSNLAEKTIYTLTLQPIENAGGQETAVKVVSFTTGDFTNPTINVANVIDNTLTGFTFKVNVSEDATVYYVVDPDNSTPSEAEIRAGKSNDASTAEGSGSFAVSANIDATDLVSGLPAAAKYYIYYFAEDLALNTNTIVKSGIPVLNSSSIQNLAPFQFDLRVSIDEVSTAHYVVTQSSTPPSAAQILAGQNESGGAPDAAGTFAVGTANTNTDHTISSLNDGTTYYVYYLATDAQDNQTVRGSKTATTPDGTPPSVVTLNPADGSATVDISTNTFTLTFDENVTTINSAATTNADRVRLFEEGVMVEDIDRDDTTVGTDGAINANGSSATATITFVYALKPNKNYYILIGGNVFEDAAGNNFAGYAAVTDWNFTTSTVTVNNTTTNICSGSFQSIGNIVISETGVADFNNGAGKTLVLTLANTAEFVIANSGVSVSGTSADVSGLSVSVGMTSLTVTYTVSGGTVLDNITISGLKIYATGVVANTTVIRTGGTASQDGNNGTGGSSLTYATINVGNTAPAQTQLAASQDLIHCDGEDLSAKTLTVVDQGPVTYYWYSDASLSTLAASTSSTTVNIVSDLGMTSPAVPGTYSYYVVTVDACQSAPALEVSLDVSVNPVADAGADKTGVNAVCPGTQLTLGGNPTLQTPSAPGSYTYSWEYVESTPEPNAEANPTYTVDNVSTTDPATYNFQVTITDSNGCIGTDIATIEVKPTFTPSLASPNSWVFSPNSPNQTLVGSPAGGVFSGVGVVQSNPTTYQFSPAIAHATDPNTLPKYFDIYYTVTSGGCTQTNFQVATFTISNSFFTNLQPQYCSSEFPDPAISGVALSLDANGYTYVDSRKTSWNTNDRFYRGPYNNPWSGGTLYGYNSYVRYNNEIYRCNSLLLGCSGFATPDTDPVWVNENILKVKFDGLIQNYYEGYYGGNSPASTIVKSGSTYSVGGNVYNYYMFGTNENYLNCPGCNYAYPAVYLEFERPEDIRSMLSTWYGGYYYYMGDLVYYNNNVYRCIVNYSLGQPDITPSEWTNVTNSDYSNGYYFHKYDGSIGAFRSGFYVNGQFVQINRNPTVFFAGLANAQSVCEFDLLNLDDVNSSGTNVYLLTGNYANTGLVQDFSVMLDGSPGFDLGSGSITNSLITPGTATFDTKTAFLNSSGGSSSLKNVQIRYRVDPGTDGSTTAPCYGTSTITVPVLQNSTFDFDNSIVDADGSIYCYTEAAKSLRAVYNATVINGAAGSPNSVTYSGFGVNDLGNSLATFIPSLAIEQTVPGTTTQQSIPVTLVYNDASQCKSTRSRTFKVNPDLQPSFAFGGRLNYCYEDISNAFTGHVDNFTWNSTPVSSSGKYEFYYKDPGSTQNLLGTQVSNNTNFIAQTYYDQIQGILTSGGYTGSLNQAANVDVTYTETLNAGKVCTETFTQTMVINPPIILDIFGLNNGDVLCRNDNTNVSQGHIVTFDGSVTGSGLFSLDDDADFSAVNPTLNSTVNTTSGKATINLLSAYNAASDATDPRQVFLQYQYTGAGCTGPADVVKGFEISPPPALAFDFGTSPANGEVFCYDEVPAQLATIQNTNVTLTGYGITDGGGGTGTFNPQLAYNTSVSNGGTLNTTQNILITSRIVDGVGCANMSTVTYDVNPVPTATLNTGSLDYCYEDTPRTLQGQQANSWFYIVYQGVVTPHTDNSLGDINNPMSSISFDPKARFDEAVDPYGASALTPAKFDVYYTTFDNNQCTNTIGPYTLTVANQIDVTIAGLDNNDIYCSNENQGVKVLTFNPFPASASKRSFTINGQNTPLASDKYDFNPGLAGGDFTLEYIVISGNNCTNTETTTVKVLPSPLAVFNVQPRCDGDLIDFNADGTNNLSSALYTWTLSDSVRTGQNLQHRFPGVSTYSVQLHVQYPAYNSDPTLVCKDSLRLDQIVGPVPNMSFKFFNVCESDQTSFVAEPNIPISTVSWDFRDGETTPLGFLANNVPPTATTSGTFGEPVHQYATAGSYNVVVTGKTAPIFGGCVDTDTLEVAILKNWAPSPTEPFYDMAALNGGNGFWVREDVNGNSTWEFNTPSKQIIASPEMAWVTGASQPYKDFDVSYVNSPCFDLSGFSRPVFSMRHWTNTLPADGAVVQYSVDGGETWSRLGDVDSGLGWYDQLTISANPGEQTGAQSGWSTAVQGTWTTGKHTLDVLPVTRTQVRFRVSFASLRNTNGRDGFAFNDVVIEERNRTILAENFTGLDQTDNNNQFKLFRAPGGVFNTEELVKLQYHHANGGTTDVINQANAVDQNARAAFYGVTTPTRAFIDGGFGQSAPTADYRSGSLETYFSLRSLVTSPVDISIDFLPTPADKLNVKATVQATTLIGKPGQFNVFIAVAERDTLGQIYVLRKFLPDAAGTPLTSLDATDPAQEVIASYDMRQVSRLQNGDYAPFAVIVFVQNLETKEVLQTEIRQDGTASSNIVTGVETSPDNQVRLYPNPADDHLNVILPSPVKVETPLKVFDTFGRQVFDGSFRPGENLKEIHTKNLSSGVYLIELSTPGGQVRKKTVVAHE